MQKLPAGSGDGQTGTTGAALASPLRVLITQNGAPQSGVTVTWGAATGGGSLAPASGTTSDAGIASATWTLGPTAGAQTATATAAGVTGSPQTFTAQATAPTGGTVLQKPDASGDGQTGPAGAALPQPLRVLVTENGAAKSGVAVTWSAGTGNGSLAPPTSQTGADGIATTTWTLGPVAGAQAAQAAVEGAQGSPLPFTATATGGGGGNVVQVGNNFYTPQTMTIPVGSTVTWQWGANATAHNVISIGTPSFQSSPTQNGPFTYSVTFTAPGTYRYYCSVHASSTDPVSPGFMTGSITVQ
jgi:plastocyanin